MFELHPQLAKDCLLIEELTLCSVLLLNDSNYPWLILVPRRDNIREIFELSEADQVQLMRESSAVAAMMARHFAADKMNVAALGNQVPQLHIHHIARYTSDVSWPGPVWGVVPPQPYSEQQLPQQIDKLRQLLADF